MDDEMWPLTSKAIADAERATGPGEADLTDQTEPELGNSWLRALAAEGVLDEREPGRYYISKLRPDRDKLS